MHEKIKQQGQPPHTEKLGLNFTEPLVLCSCYPPEDHVAVHGEICFYFDDLFATLYILF